LSELRLLALAQGRSEHARITAAEARAMLEEGFALNLDLLFPQHTEATRALRRGTWLEKAERLFAYLGEELGLSNLGEVLRTEIDAVCAQRPINTAPVRRIISMLGRVPGSQADDLGMRRYVDAVFGVTDLARENEALADYRAALLEQPSAQLAEEAERFGASLRDTGLVSRHHAVLLRALRKRAPELLAPALGLNASGQAELDEQREFAHQLLKMALLPATCQAIYGFAQVLERSLLSRPAVAAGLRRLVDLDLSVTARKALLSQRAPHEGVTANQILVAGALSVLGQPLGVGQGRNPTCQAARGISLWS
ncbi:MAG TPA: hypothetical protein DEA08_26565, partial [Planctomycetes bacterium]|nr:hypothetical protein [Planctomycetota bacterium]